MDREDANHAMETQAQELAALDAQIHANEAEVIKLSREREALQQRREFVATRLERERLRASMGSYVKLIGAAYMEPKTVVKPKAGAIGRLIRIGRTRAIVDFGEDLHVWYVPLTAVSPVTDPLAHGPIPEQSPILQALEQSLQQIHEDILGHDELTDEERWEDDSDQS
jgi:hypothetical protein